MTEEEQADAAGRAGALAERARMRAILCHEEARGREAFAQHLAFETNMNPEAAIDCLKVAGRTHARPALAWPHAGAAALNQVPEPRGEKS